MPYEGCFILNKQKGDAMPAQLSEAFAKVSENGKIPVSLEKPAGPAKEDEFLSVGDLVPIKRDAAERYLKRCLSELMELIKENRWEDVVAIYHPVSEKQPELIQNDLDAKVRAKVAFALGHLNRFDDAIGELSICTKKDPENFHFYSSLAYTAYNSIFAAINREIFLSGKARSDRINLAHASFRRAQELKPDGVTNYYRQGMLYKKIEGKNEKSIPLFETAVANWDRLTGDEKKARHQERKNYVKALYQLASGLLAVGSSRKAQVKERDRSIKLPPQYAKSDYLFLLSLQLSFVSVKDYLPVPFFTSHGIRIEGRAVQIQKGKNGDDIFLLQIQFCLFRGFLDQLRPSVKPYNLKPQTSVQFWIDPALNKPGQDFLFSVAFNKKYDFHSSSSAMSSSSPEL